MPSIQLNQRQFQVGEEGIRGVRSGEDHKTHLETPPQDAPLPLSIGLLTGERDEAPPGLVAAGRKREGIVRDGVPALIRLMAAAFPS